MLGLGLTKPIARIHHLGTSEPSSDGGYWTANPAARLTREQSFRLRGYKGERIRKIFLNNDIDCRHLYLEGALNREETLIH
jgi:hypothetical protein